METEKLEELLEQEIRDDLEGMSDLELGSEEYDAAISEVTKLMDRAIELKKVEIDAQDKNAKREAEEFNRLNELRIKEEQIRNEQKDRRTGHWIAIGTTLLSAGVAVWGTIVTLNFDKTGTVTTSMGRGWINKLFPKK